MGNPSSSPSPLPPSPVSSSRLLLLLNVAVLPLLPFVPATLEHDLEEHYRIRVSRGEIPFGLLWLLPSGRFTLWFVSALVLSLVLTKLPPTGQTYVEHTLVPTNDSPDQSHPTRKTHVYYRYKFHVLELHPDVDAIVEAIIWDNARPEDPWSEGAIKWTSQDMHQVDLAACLS